DFVDAVVRRGVSWRVVLDRAGRIEIGRAEDGRGGGVDDTLDPALVGARGLEDIRGADDVDEGAPRRVLAAEGDLPRGEVDDTADPVIADDADQGVAVRGGGAHDRDAARDVAARERSPPPGVGAG